MCGLAGAWNVDRRGDNCANVEAMIATLRHRGPDGDGVWSDAAAGFAIGHRRLAILDLSERGAQPMRSPCGRYVVAFNGEIYNHRALRAKLEEVGAAPRWRGTSDTETLLAGIVHWGLTRTLEKSVGMFAIALWDTRAHCLTLARDRFGEKPLYFGWIGSGGERVFVFGSELKALRAHPGFANSIDRGALSLFLRYSYVPAPYSIYRDVFKLEPGMTLSLDAESLARREPTSAIYYSISDVARAGMSAPILDEREGLERLESALREAVALQITADVPVGAFLSGGIDSSIIVALAQEQSPRPIETFTVGFEEAQFDEAPHAAAVAQRLGTRHSEIRVSSARPREVIPRLPTSYDEPFGDSSQIAMSVICAVARMSVTVALSGDGGDELLGGYNRYVWGPRVWRDVGWAPVWGRRAFAAALRAVPIDGWNRIGGLPMLDRRFSMLGQKAHKLATPLATASSIMDLYRAVVSQWNAESVPVLDAPSMPTKLDAMAIVEIGGEAADRMMLLDTATYLPDDILTKVDRAAMSVGLETRIPFLDHRVMEVAWRLPLSAKIRGEQGKWALRQLLYRRLPPELVERPKAGFAVPLAQWLRGPLRDWAEPLIADARLRGDGFFDAESVRTLWREHISGRRDWSGRLWNIVMFQAWLDEQ